MASDIHIQALDKSLHDRANFDCGASALNDYLAKQAALDLKRKAAGCWVITAEADCKTVLGDYTLSAEAIDALDLPEMPKAISKKLPRYRRFGAALLGRLTVDKSQQGRGIGELLLNSHPGDQGHQKPIPISNMNCFMGRASILMRVC